MKFVEKIENPPNIPEAKLIEYFWSILKSKIWNNQRIKSVYVYQKMDLNLVHDLLAHTSSMLDKIRNNDVIEKKR